MSLKASFQLILHLHEFANVDLPNQGLFCIQVSVYHERKAQKKYAVPYPLITEKPEKFIVQGSSQPVYRPAFTNLNSFCSKTKAVKYLDQKIKLDDIIRFKLQIQAFPNLFSDDVYLEFDLLFCSRYSHHSKIDNKLISELQQSLKSVANKKFRLEQLELGLISYYQVQFPGDYAAKTNITVFGCLSNFTFGKYYLPKNYEIIRQNEDGTLVNSTTSSSNSSAGVKQKQIERTKVSSFQGMLQWAQKYYPSKSSDPYSYFYNTYVKNLRFYFYSIQERLNKKSQINSSIRLKVPVKYLQLPTVTKQQSTEVNQQVFKKYITEYQPKQVSSQQILKQLNQIYIDIYQFLLQVEKEFVYDQLQFFHMMKQFNQYIKQRYGQRVFKSIVYGDNHALSAKQNKKIAKKMRQKSLSANSNHGYTTVQYPIIDMEFQLNREMMEYVFYEATYPTKKKPELRYKLNQNGFINGKWKLSTDFKTEKKQQKKQSQDKQIKERQTLCQVVEQKKKQQIEVFNIDERKIEEDSQVKLYQQQEEHQTSRQNNKVDFQKKNQTQVVNNQNQQDYPSDSAERDFTQQLEDQMESNQYNVKSLIKEKSKDGSSSQDQSEDEQQFPQIQYDEKNMLIVLCHGFQGSSYDMMIIYRSLKEIYPDANFLVSKANQNDTQGDIAEMGKKLAYEIMHFIRNYLDEDKVIINLAGHSMGGVIARSCIKHLVRRYHDRFGFFCSLSSPHLGYLNGVTGMIKAGLWMIRKFKPIKSLQQLSMEDSSNPRSTFLYKLSEEGSLKRFRKIILWSSFEDSYVAWHSARISVHHSHTTQKKSDFLNVEKEMVKNLVGKRPIHRIDVNFNIKTQNLDSFIGRTAHINLIVQERLFKIINTSLPELFDITKS